ncbi:MAG: zinc ribbon domain-containing protein [Pseudomonadota bacterium]|nr:zinc ribbon domain-containing protein [Pseudomonadota bacterium]
MPTYDYRCSANDQTISVWHGVSAELKTWGDLCAAAGAQLGDTPADAPVERLITGGNFVSGAKRALPQTMPCGQTRCGCGPGGHSHS